MEEVLIKAAEYGSVGGVSIILTYLYLKFGKNGKNSKQEMDIALIKQKIELYENNHFPTIEKRFEKNDKDHDKLMENDILIMKSQARIEALLTK